MGITCKELDDMLDGHLDTSLDGARRTELIAHLSKCSPCRRYASGYEAARNLARTHSLPADENGGDCEAWLDELARRLAAGGT